ncbi:hypothetical protein E4U41_001330 [Claviceps citrina]|nr:hypothetical protein E4U41_001330 [Claviceps citrina]
MSPTKQDDRSDTYVLPSVAYEDFRPRPSIVKEKPAHVQRTLLDEEPQCNTATLANRRNQVPPNPIKTFSSAQNSRGSPVKGFRHLEPPTLYEEHDLQQYVTSAISSSHYENSASTKHTFDSGDSGQPGNPAINNVDNSGAKVTTPEVNPEYPRRQQSLAQKMRQTPSIVDKTHWPHISSTFLSDPSPYLASKEGPQNPSSIPPPSSQCSPLPLYFRGQGYPTAKKGSKTMIGCNGWLESTDRAFEYGKKPQSKRLAFIDSIKRMAKDVTAELNPSSRRPNLAFPGLTSTQIAISLDAREQSLLYCELEFHLTSALNDYLISEFEKGHVVANNLKKISDLWLQHGRPRVISFRYDLETQLELIELHLNEFNFYGRRQSNPSEISGLLHAMKVNARAMRVRTFCQPDSVIAKQLVDSQSLFNLLNVSYARQHALVEIAHFFKTIVERESRDNQKPMRDDANSSITG